MTSLMKTNYHFGILNRTILQVNKKMKSILTCDASQN